MPTYFKGNPQFSTLNGITPRNVFSAYSRADARFVPSFYVIDGTNSRDTGETPTSLLRAGLILGKVTSTSKYRNSVIGVTTAAASSSATSVTVPASVATEVARLIVLAAGNVSLKLIGPPTSGGTVATLALTVSAASGTTLTCSALSAAAAAGSIVCPGDGSQPFLTNAMTVLTQEYGVDVTDINGNSLDQPLEQYCIGGDLNAANIINLSVDDFGNSVDTSVTAFLKSCLQGDGRNFTFSTDR